MTKTWLSITTALVLAAVSLVLIGARRYILGEGLPRAATWKVTMTAAGELRDDASITMERPPDFRQQHIVDERFHSNELTYSVGRGTNPSRRQVVWRRSSTTSPQPFRTSY